MNIEWRLSLIWVRVTRRVRDKWAASVRYDVDRRMLTKNVDTWVFKKKYGLWPSVRDAPC